MADEDRTFAPNTVPSKRTQPGQGLGRKAAGRNQAQPGARLDDRNAAGRGDAGDLGASTPANVDVHDLGQQDRPQEEWGDQTDEEMLHSSNHTRRPIKTEADRAHGAKTRRLNKDIISRRT